MCKNVVVWQTNRAGHGWYDSDNLKVETEWIKNIVALWFASIEVIWKKDETFTFFLLKKIIYPSRPIRNRNTSLLK